MNINFSELVVILVVTLLLFGPDKLPDIARQLGKLAAEARKATNAVRREFYNTVYQPADEVRRDLLASGESLRSLKAQIMTPPEGAHGVPSRSKLSNDKTTTPDGIQPEPLESSDTGRSSQP